MVTRGHARNELLPRDYAMDLRPRSGRNRVPNAGFTPLKPVVDGSPEMIPRRSFMALTAAAAFSEAHAAGAGGDDIFHVAIFRFTKENLDDVMAAFRALVSATRQEPGNIAYDIYRGLDDDLEFYIVEHWASPAALAAHERTQAFIHYGRGVLVRHATLHDTVTGRPFA